MDDPFRIPPVLYYVVMGIVIIGWIHLILFSRRHWANFWFAGLAVPVTLCLFYMYLLIVFFFQPPPLKFSEFFTLEGVYRMFSNSGLLLVGWINILAMDLVAGAWMARKAAQVRMPAIYLIPCLILTFLFAGFGFALFCIAMSFGERWGAIAKLEQVPPVKRAVFPAFPAEGVSS